MTLSSAYGQSGISIYHMQGATFQGSHFNPSFIPDGKIFFGLPVLSGIAINYNNFLSYSDAIRTNEMGLKEVNFDNIVSTAKTGRNMINLEADISTFYLGFRGKNSAITFFVNERIAARAFLTGEVLELAWKGNEAVVGEEIDLSGIAGDARYYREMGIGIWKHLPKIRASFGVRFKYINGIFGAATDNGFKGQIVTQEDNFQFAFNLSNAVVNTSGIDIIDNGVSSEIQSHIMGNSNVGFGIDIGANWKINKYISAAVAVNDFGFINWKVNPRNFSVQDTTFSYGGLELRDVSDFEQSLEDSLRNRFNDVETANSYKTLLNTRTYASLIYDMSERDKVIATIANHGVSGKLRMLYGLGYTRKVGRNFNFSANVVRLPQQNINLGLGAAVNLGSLQIYMASDHILGVADVTKLTGLDLRFGMNFIFGRDKPGKSSKTTKDDRSDLEHNNDLGKGQDKGPKRDGIYYIIKRKKPRPIYEKKKFREV